MKLSNVQAKVMGWLRQNWSATYTCGDVQINGLTMCPLSTMEALERKGLVRHEVVRGARIYVATEAGKSYNAE